MAYDNSNGGALFRNEDRESDKQPTHKGQIQTTCAHCNKESEFWASGWVKTAGPRAKNPGSKFMSVAVTPKEDKQSSTVSTAEIDEFDDDIPF